MDEPVIAPSARKHGIADADVLHACRHATLVAVDDKGLHMAIGPTHAGNLVEIGYVVGTDDIGVIVQAMHARPKFLEGR